MRREFLRRQNRNGIAKRSSWFVSVILIFAGFIVSCANVVNLPSPTPTHSRTVPTLEPSALLNRETPVRAQSSPYPFTTALPPAIATKVDGVYAKNGTYKGTPTPCRRCPDYLPYEGAWTLWLDKGVYRVHFTVTGWRSVGSFTVSENRITFFNDPTCTQDAGTYEWQLSNRKLTLKPLQDQCMFGLRQANFSGGAWNSCTPPNVEAGVTDHWQKPVGCS